MPRDIAAIIAAAGQSRRFGDRQQNKTWERLDQKAVWLHSAERFLNRDDVQQVIVVIAASDREEFLSRFGPNVAILGIDVVDGGAERADSVQRGLEKVTGGAELVLVHDAARPCLTDRDVDAVIDAGRKHGAAILASPVNSTLKQVTGDTVSSTVDRHGKWLAQTPQVFRRQWLEQAFAARGNHNATDEAELLERAGLTVHVVNGSPLNVKITTRDDLKLAAAILKSQPARDPFQAFHPFKS